MRLVAEKRGGLFKKRSNKPTRAMDDSGVESIQKLAVVGLHPLRRQASDTNLTSADYSGRAGAKVGGGMQTAGGGAGKRSKSPFSLFRRPKTQEQSPIRAGDLQGRDTLPMHITVSTRLSILLTFYRVCNTPGNPGNLLEISKVSWKFSG